MADEPTLRIPSGGIWTLTPTAPLVLTGAGKALEGKTIDCRELRVRALAYQGETPPADWTALLPGIGWVEIVEAKYRVSGCGLVVRVSPHDEARWAILGVTAKTTDAELKAARTTIRLAEAYYKGGGRLSMLETIPPEDVEAKWRDLVDKYGRDATLGDLAREVGVDERTIRNWRANGQIRLLRTRP